MHRSYHYRLNPTPYQERQLLGWFGSLRELYNAALQERRDAYRKQKISVSKNDQFKQLKDIRASRDDIKLIPVAVLRSPLHTLDNAFKSFFRRCKSGEKPGFPRFKGRDRLNSFYWPSSSKRNWIVSGGKRIDLPYIGKVKIKIHQKMEGTLQQIKIKRSLDGKWYAILVCKDVPKKPLPVGGGSIGIDVGLKVFATLSNGEMIENPRFTNKYADEVKVLSRSLAKKKKGSKRHKLVKIKLMKTHQKISNCRKDFHHKVSRQIVNRFDSIAVEDLNIKGLIKKGSYNKSIHDVAWNQFIFCVSYKAESAGREFKKVNPRGTSQMCSKCGIKVPKTLRDRQHDCPHCGLSMDRDLNAAINIKNRAGQVLQGGDQS